MDTMTDVKASANNAVEQAKQVFDINQQMQERPWTTLGASVVAGYVLGSLGGDDQPSSHYREPSPRYSSQSSQPGMLDDVIDQFRDEFELLKGAAITTVTNLLHDMLKNNVPQFADALEQARSERDQPGQTSSAL